MSTRRVRSTQAKTTVVLQCVHSYILPHDGRDPLRVQWSTPGTGVAAMPASSAAASTSCGRGSAAAGTAGGDGAGTVVTVSVTTRAASGALSDGGYRATGTPRLPRLAPRQGGHPERLGPTKGRTITLLAQLRGTRVHGRNRFRAQPDVYGQFHTMAESSWRWGHPARLLSVIPC